MKVPLFQLSLSSTIDPAVFGLAKKVGQTTTNYYLSVYLLGHGLPDHVISLL